MKYGFPAYRKSHLKNKHASNYRSVEMKNQGGAVREQVARVLSTFVGGQTALFQCSFH